MLNVHHLQAQALLHYITHQSRWLLALALLTCTLLHLPLSELPLGRDQGIWSSIGLALLDGDIFFKDITHFNLPGLGFAYALAFTVTDNPSLATMLLSLSSSLLTILGLYYLLKTSISPQAGIIAAWLWAILWPSYLNFWLIAQKDVLAIPGLLFSAYFLAKSTEFEAGQGRILVYLSGLCAALCILFKPVFIIYALSLGLVVIAISWQKKHSPAQLIFALCALIAGGLSIGIPLISYILVNGALDKAMFGLLQFAPWYSMENHQAAWFIALKLLARSYFVEFHFPVFAIGSLIVWTPVLVLALVGFINIKARKKYWLLLPTAGALAVYFVQNKGFGYHAAPWQACLLLFTATGIYWLLCQQQHWKNAHVFKRYISLIIGLCILLQVTRAYTVTHYTQHYLASYLGLISHKQMLDVFKVDQYTVHPNISHTVAQWIKSHSQADDRIVIWGQENQIYAMSGRRHATEHTFDFPLSALVIEDTHPQLFKLQQALRQQYVHDLREQQPKFFIVVSRDKNPVEPADSDTVLYRVKGLEALLSQHYQLVKQIERFKIYQFKDD